MTGPTREESATCACPKCGYTISFYHKEKSARAPRYEGVRWGHDERLLWACPCGYTWTTHTADTEVKR